MGKFVLENMHAQFPDARLGIVVASRAEMIRDLFAAYPWLEVVEANRRSPWKLFTLLKNFWGSDLVVMQYAGKPGGSFGLASKLFARVLAKRGGLVGFTDAFRWNKYLYDMLVPMSSDTSVVERDRAALRAARIPINLPFPLLQCVENSSVLQKFDLEKGKFIIVHLFAGNAGRGLHPDKKRELLIALAKKLPDTRLVLSGGTHDRAEALLVAEGVSATVVAGETSLQDMMNLVVQSRAVVSVDTGMAHIAAQLRKPLVVMRTCLGANWWFSDQYGSDASIAVFACDRACEKGHVAKEYPACMGGIDMGEVAECVAATL